MARSYARITTSIWRDEDFRDLTVEQQALYFLLDSQAEISAAGTLPLTERRWSKLARDWSVDRISKVLGELADRGHVAIDEDTEEVLMVKFVKWDQGYSNGKRVPVIREAAMAIASPILRRALAAELRQLGLSDMASELVGDTPPDSQPDAVSASDRVVVKERNQTPQPATPNPAGGAVQTADPEPPGDSVAQAPPAMFCSKHPNGTEERCGACADARKRYAAHVQATTEREVEAKRAAAQARAACDLCDEHGKRLDPTTRLPTGRCDHRRSA